MLNEIAITTTSCASDPSPYSTGAMASGSEQLVPDVFDTSQFDPMERFDRWREHLAPALSMDRPITDPGLYQARHESWNIGDFVFARETTTGGFFSRDDLSRRAARDHWCLLYLKAGSDLTRAGSGVGERETTSHARAGSIGFYSLSQSCKGVMRDVSALTLFIPRERFEKQAQDFDGLANTILSTPRARMLGDYLLSLERELAAFTNQDAVAAAAATSALISACLSPTPDRMNEAEAPTYWLNRTRAGRYIERHLDDPALTPERLCRELGVSRSALYRLFEPAGGVTHHIRRARLYAAHHLLSDDQATRRIGEIAGAVGFTDVSDFSRAFKREFAYAPSDARDVIFDKAMERRVFATGRPENSFASWFG